MRLQAIDQLTLSDHSFLNKKDLCFFFGTYLLGAKWDYDDFHQLFWNFKKPLGSGGQEYKRRAVARVGEMIADNCESLVGENALLIPIPPSKIPSHPEYDDRCFRAVQEAEKSSTASFRAVDAIRQLTSTEPVHKSSRRLRPEEHQENFEFYDESLIARAEAIIIFDDLITTGSHFRAVSNMILDVNPDCHVIGIFLGRRKPKEESARIAFGSIFRQS